MSDLISRSALMEAPEKEQKECEIDMTSPNFFKAKMIAREQPTIEAVPVVERNKIIDEFADRLKHSLIHNHGHLLTVDTDGFEWLTTDAVGTHIDEISERMKGGAE